MKKITVANKILRSLIDSSKTTAELAIELGYVTPEGLPRYNFIDAQLKNMVRRGLIVRKKRFTGKSGAPPTVYSIIKKT